MDEIVKNIEKEINEFLVSFNNGQIAENLELFYFLSVGMAYCFEKFGDSHSIDIQNIEIDYENVSKITLTEKIEIIKKFYKDHNISFDIETHVADGTIDLKYGDLNENKRNLLHGFNYYENGHRLIDVYNYGLVTDLPIMIHELSHYRNQPSTGRNQVSDLLTEVLASCEELIFIDYLSKLGYEKEAILCKKEFLKIAQYRENNNRPILKMIVLFDKYGNISKQSYKDYFKLTTEYDKIIKYMSDFNHTYELSNTCHYTLAFFLTNISNYPTHLKTSFHI